jgi:hypothetical protein
MVAYRLAADTVLIEPHNLTIDRSLRREQAGAEILAARRYDTFWDTGDEELARAALAPNFVDDTLPAGRAQGIDGPLAASRFMRVAIPDLRCEIEQMIVAGDRVVTHCGFAVSSRDALGRSEVEVRSSISSPLTSTASPTDALLRIGTSKTT